MNHMVVSLGEVAAAAGDAYQASQGATAVDSAAFAAAVASLASTAAQSGAYGSFGSGIGTGTGAAAGAAAVGLNVANLVNASTPAEALSAALGIIGGTASSISPFVLPGPQKAALTALAAWATLAQLAIKKALFANLVGFPILNTGERRGTDHGYEVIPRLAVAVGRVVGAAA